jgi:CubicO group peptidase (beta-lactamase class C family)
MNKLSISRRKFLFLASALPVAMHNTTLRGANPTHLDYLEKLVKEGVVPGVALVASRDGKIIIQQALGTYCRIDDRAATIAMDTIHPLYSFSKIITGTVVAMAVTEGRLAYGDLISKYIPEFKGGGKEGITLRHCLSHSAGLIKVQAVGVRNPQDWNATLDVLCQATVDWEPGSRTAYHGWSGAFLAAECVRRVYENMPWPALCKEKLFAPLGASSLSFELPGQDAKVAIVPQPPAARPLPKTPETAFGYAGHPGAGCFGTLPDALRVMQFHLQWGIWGSKQLISKDIFNEMHRVQYEQEIGEARAAGRQPLHEPWGLGPLLRGPYSASHSHSWHGFYNQAAAGIFGHSGISTLTSVGDLESRIAFVFVTTDAPRPANKVVEVRNRVTDLVFEYLS